MGGYMINGMGAADSFYLLKSLPGHLCRSCGKKDYALMEVKRKIRILYIPTVSINTKYAVTCPKCKHGYYISEEQKEYILLNDPSCVEVGNDGVTIFGIAERNIQDEPKEDFVTIVEENSAQKNLCQCGAELPMNAIFCVKCGMKVSKDSSMLTEEEKQKPTVVLPEEEFVLDDTRNDFSEIDTEPLPQLKICRCGASLSTSAIYCTSCGAKLGEDSAPEQVADVVVPSLEDMPLDLQKNNAFQPGRNKSADPTYKRGKKCPECGMRTLPGREICGICGTKLE